MSAIPETGVVVLEGLPGHGKSFLALSKCIDILERDQRPVYTNLPLRWRVFRQYLRTREIENLEGMLFPLTQDHFLRFIKRAVSMTELRDRMRASCQADGRTFSENAFERAFFQAEGPHVYRGEAANYIHQGSVIFIDESQNWFPMQTQKDETPYLRRYLTMVRHHIHLVWFITQDRMNLTLTARRLAENFWHVRKRENDAIFAAFRLGHLGLTGFGAIRRTQDQEEAMGQTRNVHATYSEAMNCWFTVFGLKSVFGYPLSREVWKFRLYDSFTHVGGYRRMMRVLKRMRESFGVLSQHELAVRELVDMGTKLRALARTAFWGFFVAMPLVLGVAIGKSTAPKGAAVVVQAQGGDWFSGLKLTGMSRSVVVVNGKSVQIGGLQNGAKLVSVDPARRRSVWEFGGVGWMWKLGSSSPTKLGTIPEISDRIRKSLEARAAAIGRGQSEAGAEGGGSVGPSQGHIGQ